MVTSRHETAHRIFQERPALLAPTFRLLGVSLPEDSSVEVLTPDATELKPIERRIDTVLRLRPRDGGKPTLLAIEAQSRCDPDKVESWAYYLGYLMAKEDCFALLVVVCQDKKTAEWAMGPFHLGPDDWQPLTVRPLVLGPGNVPVIIDPEEAAQDLAMAAFTAVTHGKSPDNTAILEALAHALGRADSDTLKYYAELVESGLGEPRALKTWRALMQNGSYFPGRGTLVEETFLEGQASGEAKGKAAGLAEGQVKERARSVLLTLKMRDLPVSDAQRTRVTSCTDLDTLDLWLERAFRATEAEQLFDDETPAAPDDAPTDRP
ncbi:hypothetical protein [Streptomyces axinellae]|uniref:Transposase n=1 Tax=Streptomyces axinellae TaxID=552788 RepID=A0ABN3QL39_9ACTN